MRAAVVDRFGPPDVVRMEERPMPVPGKGRVLVRVRAAAVTSADARIRGARFPRGFGIPAHLAFGIRKPRRPVLGSSVSGVVESLGEGVTGLAPGDEVCGMSGSRMGAHAEFVAVDAKRLVRRPDAVSPEDAAGLLFGGTTALHFLHTKVPVRPGMTVLINGASGAIGTTAVQLAVNAGAEVTAVTSGRNATLAQELGAQRVIDYTQQSLADLPNSYDLVLDTFGTLDRDSGRRLLNPGGTVVLAVADLADTLRARGNVVAGVSSERPEAFTALLEMVEQGHLRVVTDRVLPLTDVVEAHRVVDSGRKVGNIVLVP